MVNCDKIVEKLINECSDKLSEWESDFINSIYEQDYPLTENQKRVVLRINNNYRKSNK